MRPAPKTSVPRTPLSHTCLTSNPSGSTPPFPKCTQNLTPHHHLPAHLPGWLSPPRLLTAPAWRPRGRGAAPAHLAGLPASRWRSDGAGAEPSPTVRGPRPHPSPSTWRPAAHPGPQGPRTALPAPSAARLPTRRPAYLPGRCALCVCSGPLVGVRPAHRTAPAHSANLGAHGGR